ncbi:transaldolase family protein [Streptomyces sp. O3]
MPSVLERLQDVNESAEIWWDSSPLDFPAWRDELLASAPDLTTRGRWAEQLARFLSPQNPQHSLVRGVTTNPSLVAQSVLAAPERWSTRVRALIRDRPLADVEDTYAAVYQDVLSRSAAEMLPTWQASDGRYGWVSGQLDPRLTFHTDGMLQQALRLAQLAPNLMVKVPGSAEGYRVIEELVARGISINSTLSYTVPQFMACAEAVERGLARARASGVDATRCRAVFTHMIGRFGANLDLRYEAEARGIDLSQTDLRWAEIAVLKRIHTIIRERALPLKPLLSSLLADDPQQGATTLALHLEQTAGGDIAYTCKPRFIADMMRREHELDAFRPGAIDEDVPHEVLERLLRLPSFQHAYAHDGIAPEDFAHYGCFVSTYAEVLQNTRKLIDFVARNIQEATTSRELVTAGR